jgi:hypothetical protein
MFLETAAGIVREHLWLLSPGEIMRTTLKTFGSSALIGFLTILPFMTMEVVNRRNYEEEFPVVLFSGLWFNVFAICLILLPLVPGIRSRKQAAANPVPERGDTLLTNPRPAALISLILILAPLILFWLGSLGWAPMQSLINGPDPEQAYLPGLFFSYGLLMMVVAGGMIACGPVVRTLRAGGSLFAHPLHLFIVVALSSLIAIGFTGLIVDQWPCFIGVPVCD